MYSQGQAIRKRMVLSAKLSQADRKSKNISLSNLVIFFDYTNISKSTEMLILRTKQRKNNAHRRENLRWTKFKTIYQKSSIMLFKASIFSVSLPLITSNLTKGFAFKLNLREILFTYSVQSSEVVLPHNKYKPIISSS